MAKGLRLYTAGECSGPPMARPLRVTSQARSALHVPYVQSNPTGLKANVPCVRPIKNPRHFCLGLFIGGGGGNRTPVRKSATRGPTCLVSSLVYPCRYRRTGATRGARDISCRRSGLGNLFAYPELVTVSRTDQAQFSDRRATIGPV